MLSMQHRFLVEEERWFVCKGDEQTFDFIDETWFFFHTPPIVLGENHYITTLV